MFAATAPWTIIATAHSMVLAIIQIMLNKENYNVLSSDYLCRKSETSNPLKNQDSLFRYNSLFFFYKQLFQADICDGLRLAVFFYIILSFQNNSCNSYSILFFLEKL